MEVRFNIRQVVMWRIVLFSGIISLICACSYSGKKVCPPFDISFSGHTLLAIAPGFTIKATEDTLNKTYPCLRSGKMFPLTGILKVDGKSYRFLGGDSLRISSLAPLSNENLGWQGKYSYLFPGTKQEWRFWFNNTMQTVCLQDGKTFAPFEMKVAHRKRGETTWEFYPN